ncbi:MAG: ABC transporter ATP-binding protein [Lachnospiraceae bacterium]|nr:ABC transporter ATP-binding protein [Lachnospiraceae bacterium]
MAGLLLKNVNKTYAGGHQMIRDFNLEIRGKEFLILAGDEDCGKTMLLRMIAGLDDFTSGTLWIDGEDKTFAEPRDRNLAMLFKNSVPYPEMNVADNLAFALRLGKLPQKEIEQRVEETAKLLSLETVLEKKPEELTEPERFCVLLGRALIRRPQILLIDSMLADFNEESQEICRETLLKIYETLDVTVLYAADRRECITGFGSRLVLIKDGAVCQDAAPAKLYEKPGCLYAAEYVSRPPLNQFSAMVFGEENRVGLSLSGGRLILSDEQGKRLAKQGCFGKQVILGIRPEVLRLTDEKEAAGVFAAVLEGMELYKNRPLLHFTAGETVGTAFADGMPACGIGGEICLKVDVKKVFIFDADTGQSLTC